MAALLEKVSGWVHQNWSGTFAATEHKVGAYKADYSALTKDQMESEEAECAELFKHSRPVSR
ncbi:hypothetical protein BH10PSE11_BH10PSE11_08350 [soil metagenome]